MIRFPKRSLLPWVVFFAVVAVSPAPAYADEIWIAPTSQQDLGGLGIGSNSFWPVTPVGAVRFAWGVPENMEAFQGAKVVLIPHAPGGAATLNIFVCAAQSGQAASGSCSGPIAHAFAGVVNNLTEVDITAAVAAKVGLAGRTNLAVLAFTSPTTNTDHIVGLRFIHRGKAFADGISMNTALGHNAQKQGVTGSRNTALGDSAMLMGGSGNQNTAVGSNAMFGNLPITGSGNTALGSNALAQLTTGNNNTAIGMNALLETHASSDNTAVGAFANASGGSFNTALGSNALAVNEDVHNTAVGYNAMGTRNLGSRNTAVGALSYAGPSVFQTGNDNVTLGYRAGFNINSGDYNIHIANEGLEESNTLRLGTAFDAGAGSGLNRAFVAGIRGITTGMPNAVPVVIDSLGQLGTISSSRRFKEDIHDLGDVSRRLFQLRPVSFRYTQSYADGSKPVQYGLVAEEVAEAFPELAVRNSSGEVETVHYETLNVLLLNEVQQQEQRIEVLERKLGELLADLEARSNATKP